MSKFLIEIAKDILIGLCIIIGFLTAIILPVLLFVYYLTLPYVITHGIFMMTIKWTLASVIILFCFAILYGLIDEWISSIKTRIKNSD